MSQLYQPGTVTLYVGPQNVLGGAAGVWFLGVGKMSPQTELINTSRPIETDFAGSLAPVEKGYGGEKALIVVDLSQFNYNVLMALEQHPRANAALLGLPGAPVPGNHPFGDRGSLLQTEQLMQTLFLLYTNMLIPAKAAIYTQQIPGRRFPCTECKQLTYNAKALEDATTCRVAFEATELQVFDTSTGGTAFAPNFRLWDQQVTGLPPIN